MRFMDNSLGSEQSLPQDASSGQEHTHSVASIISEIRTGLLDTIRSDVNLARLELKNTTTRLKGDAAKLVAFGVFAALGVFPLLAFAVAGLGLLLGGNYWLSAL